MWRSIARSEYGLLGMVDGACALTCWAGLERMAVAGSGAVAVRTLVEGGYLQRFSDA